MHTIAHFSKSIKCTPPIMNPDKNYGCWVITMCHCRFISCSKYTPWVGDVGNRGGLYMCGAGSISAISVPLSQFEPKAVLKSKVDFKREREREPKKNKI